MTQIDYSHLFRCPKCNLMGAIYLLKYTPKKLIIKQNCPIHGKRAFVLPLKYVENLMPLIQDSIFRCYKCGKRTRIDNINSSRQWTSIRGECEEHGNSLPYQKISMMFYKELNTLEEPKPILNEQKMYCRECGSQIQADQKFCNLCGAAIL
jgi:hypothetical protein